LTQCSASGPCFSVQEPHQRQFFCPERIAFYFLTFPRCGEHRPNKTDRLLWASFFSTPTCGRAMCVFAFCAGRYRANRQGHPTPCFLTPLGGPVAGAATPQLSLLPTTELLFPVTNTSIPRRSIPILPHPTLKGCLRSGRFSPPRVGSVDFGFFFFSPPLFWKGFVSGTSSGPFSPSPIYRSGSAH